MTSEPCATDDASKLQAYYAARAGEYERIYAKPERQADLARLRRDIPARLAGRDVLEIACGTGWWTGPIAEQARSVFAIDAAEQTLAIARAKPLRADRVRFALGDAYALQPDGGPFDAAFAGFWISHVPCRRLAEFFAQLARVLLPGARVVLLDNRYVAGSSTPVSAPDAAGDTWQIRRLDDGSSHRVLKNFPTRPALEAALGEHGHSLAWHTLDHYWWCEYRTASE